jgi:hypothetical protein
MANRRLDPVSYRPLQVDPLLSEGLLAVPRDGGDLERKVASGLARMAAEFGQQADREAMRAGELAGKRAGLAGAPEPISVSGGEATGTASVNGQAGHVRGARGGIRVTVPPAEIRKIVVDAAMRNAVDPENLLEVARIESRYDPGAKNPNSSAGGLFQFIDGTARDYGLADRYDPAQASDAAARLMRDNAAYLRRRLGRDASAGELYLAHQQGAGGASKLLANLDARAVDIVGADAVRLNGGSADMTAGQFASIWTSKVRVGGKGYAALPDADAVAPVSVTPVDEPVTIERGRAGSFQTSGRDTVYGRAYDVAGTRTYLEATELAMLENQQAIFDAYGDDPAMLEKALGENLAADLKENVLDEIAPDYELAYRKRAMMLLSKAKADKEERDKAANRVDFLDRAGKLEDEKSRALAGFNPADPEAGSGLANIQASIDAHYDSAVARGVLTEAEAAKAKQSSRDDLTVSYYVKQAAGKRPADIAAMRAELTKDYAEGLLPGMSADQFDKISTGLGAAEKTRTTQDAQANRALSLRGDTLAKKVANGDRVSAEDLARFRLDAGTAPNGQEIVRSTLSRMQVSEAIRTLPIGEVERNIERLLTVGGQKPGGEDIAFAREQIGKHRKAVESDPIGVAERFGVLPVSEPLPLDGDVSPDTAESAITGRMAAAEAAAEHFGVRPRYFRPEEIATVKRLIDEDPDAALSVAAGVVGAAGGRAGDIFREFGDRAPGMLQAGNVLVAGGNDVAARDLLAGYGKTPDGKSYTDIQPTKRRPVSEKIVGGALVFDQALARDLEAGAASIARKRVYDAGIDPKSEEAKEIYGRALNEAAGATFTRGAQYGGFAAFDPGFRWKARQVVVPSGVRADRFEEVVGALTDADLGGVSAKNGKAWAASDFQKAMPVRVAGGHVFALGDPSGANPMFIADAAGNPIVLDFDGALGATLKARVPEAFR